MSPKVKFPRVRLPQSNWARALVGVLSLSLVAGLIYAGTTIYTLAQADSQVHRIESAFPVESLRPSAADDEDGNGTNFLLLGVDSNGNVGKTQDEIKGVRADSIMVAHISHDGSYLTMISIVRDTWIDDIPGIGGQRINAAMSLGGISTMVATVEQLLKTRIDHVAIIDFDGLKRAIDQLGGVTVCNDEYFTYSIYPHYVFEPGLITLGGKEALAYSRERKHITRGDFQRAEHQRAVVLSLFHKVMSSGVLKKPLQAAQLYESVSKYLSLDPGIDFNYALSTAKLLTNLADVDGISTFTLMISGGGINEYGMSVVYLDEQKLAKVQERLAADTIHEFKKDDESPSPTPSDTRSSTASPSASKSPTSTPTESASPSNTLGCELIP